MTQLLLGAYPDVFRAGAAQAGVPFGCFAGAEEWNEACAQGQVMKSAQQWGAPGAAGLPGLSPACALRRSSGMAPRMTR